MDVIEYLNHLGVTTVQIMNLISVNLDPESTLIVGVGILFSQNA